MALFYMDVRNVQKAKQSAIAKASYVSGEKLYSERDQETKGYRTREVKPDSFILAPNHAPEWVYDREKLWNEVEAIEKPVNSRLMREVVVALPIELSNEQQRELISEYVQENFVNDGMVADVNIHRDRDQNPHAHILLTIRHFESNGEWAESRSKKEYLKDENGEFIYNEKGNKKSRNVDLTGWNGKHKIVEWRKALAEKINEFYKKNGIEQEVSHLSYEDQGVDKVSHERLSRSSYAIELKAKESAMDNDVEYEPISYYAQVNEMLDSLSGEKTQLDSEIDVLKAELEKLEAELEAEKSEPVVDIDAFKTIRENVKVSKEVFESYKFIRQRIKCGYVKLPEINKAKESIEYWKKSLNVRDRKLQNDKIILEESLKLYKDKDFESLKKIGFDPSTFVTVYREKAQAFLDKHEKLSEEVGKYREAKQFTEQAYQFEKKIVQEEFEYLHPELARIYSDAKAFDDPTVYQLMYDMNQIELGNIQDSTRFEIEQNKRQFLDAESIDKAVSRLHLNESLNEFNFYVETENKLTMATYHLDRKYKRIANDSSIDLNEKSNVYYRLRNNKNEIEFMGQEKLKVRNVLETDLSRIFAHDPMFNSLDVATENKSHFEEYTDDKLRYVAERVSLFVVNNQYSLSEIEQDYEAKNELVSQNELDEAERKLRNQDEFEMQDDSINSTGDIIDSLISQASKNQDSTDDNRNKRKRKKLTIEDKLDMDMY